METKRNQNQTITPSQVLWKKARHGFDLKGTSMTRWCDEKGLNRRNVYRAVVGLRNGPKAAEVRQMVLEAAGVI